MPKKQTYGNLKNLILEFFFKKGQCPSWYNDDYDDANDDQGQVSLQFFFCKGK